jgi:phosphoribosylformylglycinamidine synthase
MEGAEVDRPPARGKRLRPLIVEDEGRPRGPGLRRAREDVREEPPLEAKGSVLDCGTRRGGRDTREKGQGEEQELHRARAAMILSARTNKERMARARVFVTLKKSVFDPQGKTIHDALNSLGYAQVSDVRQGKYFELDLSSGLPAEEARRQVEEIAERVLSNPVIESYRVEVDP